MTRAYPACLGSDDDPVQTFIDRQLFFDGPRRPKSQVVWACAEFIHEFRLAADSGPDQEQTPQALVQAWNHSFFRTRWSDFCVDAARNRARCLTFDVCRRVFVNAGFPPLSKGRPGTRRDFPVESCLIRATAGAPHRRRVSRRPGCNECRERWGARPRGQDSTRTRAGGRDTTVLRDSAGLTRHGSRSSARRGDSLQRLESYWATS